MSNCMLLLCVDAITHPCHNPDAGLPNLFVKEAPAGIGMCIETHYMNSYTMIFLCTYTA